MNIINGFESIHEIMIKCIEKEMTSENGLLTDVETFIPIYYNEKGVEEPVIWISQHPTFAKRQADISQTLELTTPFEFTCCEYSPELEEGAIASQNLANRVILSILRNFLDIQSEVVGKRIIRTIELETYYPVGEVAIKGKSDRVPATSVILNVNHIVNWSLCCKQLNGE